MLVGVVFMVKKKSESKSHRSTVRRMRHIEPIFKIENIVASANLGVELDLYSIAQKVRDVEYEPEQFPGAILKLKDPRASLLLFKNGKIICTGSKSEREVKIALERAIKILIPHAR